MRTVWIHLTGTACLFAGCDLPRDPEGTTERVRSGVLRLGLMHDPPWTEVGREDEPYLGIEVALARQLADELGARIEWRAAGESRLMEALANYELDLVIGGLTDSSAWHKHVGLTRPYVRAPSMPEAEPGRTAAKDVGHVFAVPPGENEWLLVVEKFLERKRTEIARLTDRPMSEDQG